MSRVHTFGERIKWTYATAPLTDLPQRWSEGDPRFGMSEAPPSPGDVLVARVGELGRHTRLDDPLGGRLNLFEGDIVGLAFSPRYATAQFEAIVPPDLSSVHIVAGGGVCGRVVSRASTMSEPTSIEPLGYLLRQDGRRVSLPEFGLRPAEVDVSSLPVVLSVGASMDAGKTTAAASLVHGLARAGLSVGAAKITGTAASKDPRLMLDAGAARVLDFAAVGYASTLGVPFEALAHIATVCLTQLAASGADVAVLEVADGILQRETAEVLRWFASRHRPLTAMFSCGDAMSVGVGVERLRSVGLVPVAVSGLVTISPLSMAEAQMETDVPVLSRDDLRDLEIATTLLPVAGSSALVTIPAAREAVGA